MPKKQKKNGIYLLFYYATKIAKTRGFSKGRFFFLRSLLFPQIAANWVKFIDSYFKKIGFEIVPWDIIALPLRLCFSRHLSPAARIKTLQDHHIVLEKNFRKEVIADLTSEKKIKLATLTSKSGAAYDFNMCYIMYLRREGMLSISITDPAEENLILTSLSFTFFKNAKGENSLLIGGLQGITNKTDSAGKSTIVKTTRDLNGLRPKFAILNTLYAIAESFCVTEIIATSEKNHPVKITNQRKRGGFHADYDIFWEENGGILNADGNFILPAALPKRKLEDVPSKKKKDWLARHNYIKEMSDMTKICLDEIMGK